MPQYGEVRVDFITYTTGVSPNEGNVTVPVSGLINNPTFSGNLIVEGSGIFENNVSISGDLFVSGTTNLSGVVTTSGNVNVGGNLSVTNNLTVTGNITGDDITSTGNLTVSGNTNVNTITSTGLAQFESLFVSGSTTITGGLNVSGDTVLSGLTTKDNVTISGILTVTGNTNVGGDLAVTGNISGNLDGGVYGSGYWKVPDGTTAQRPGTPVSGMIRYNTTQQRYEGYGEDGWDILGGGATGSGTDRVFILNETGVTASYTLTGYNAVSAGAITIEDGIEVTIADTFGWSIV